MSDELDIERGVRIGECISAAGGPSAFPDMWSFADAVIALWTQRYPNEKPIDEDDVFAVASQTMWKGEA